MWWIGNHHSRRHDTFERERIYLHLFFLSSFDISKVFVTWHSRDEIVNKFFFLSSFLLLLLFSLFYSSLEAGRMGLFRLERKGNTWPNYFYGFSSLFCFDNRLVVHTNSLLIWSRPPWHRDERRTCVFSIAIVSLGTVFLIFLPVVLADDWK